MKKRTRISFKNAEHILAMTKHAPFLCELKGETENELHSDLEGYPSNGAKRTDAVCGRSKASTDLIPKN